MRQCAVAFVVLISCGAVMAAPKLTPEELVKRHLQALTGGAAIAPAQSRDFRGVCATTTPAKAAGQLAGAFRLSSTPQSARFTLEFKSDLYEGENFSVDGDQVEIGFAQPRTTLRSALGTFVARNLVIVGEGLFGGVLNARWPLLRTTERQPKLGYDGMKKLSGRDLHRLRYRAKEKQGGLVVHLYFEPDTYRHVASVYTSTQAQAMGTTIESSSQQSDTHFRLEEHFSDFQQVGGLMVPKAWTVRYERSGNTATEWKYELSVQPAPTED